MRVSLQALIGTLALVIIFGCTATGDDDAGDSGSSDTSDQGSDTGDTGDTGATAATLEDACENMVQLCGGEDMPETVAECLEDAPQDLTQATLDCVAGAATCEDLMACEGGPGDHEDTTEATVEDACENMLELCEGEDMPATVDECVESVPEDLTQETIDCVAGASSCDAIMGCEGGPGDHTDEPEPTLENACENIVEHCAGEEGVPETVEQCLEEVPDDLTQETIACVAGASSCEAIMECEGGPGDHSDSSGASVEEACETMIALCEEMTDTVEECVDDVPEDVTQETIDCLANASSCEAVMGCEGGPGDESVGGDDGETGPGPDEGAPACTGEVHVVTPALGMAFEPAVLTIAVGDWVRFEMSDYHNVVEVSQANYYAGVGTHLAGGFSVGYGETHEVCFSEPGTHYYACQPHASYGMVGRVHVE